MGRDQSSHAAPRCQVGGLVDDEPQRPGHSGSDRHTPCCPESACNAFDNHDVLATWPSADTPIGVPFGAPVQRSSVRRAQSSARAQPASPSSAQLRTADLRRGARQPIRHSPTAEGPTQRSSAGPAPSAPPPAAPVEPLAPSSDGRLSVAEAAQRLLAAGGSPRWRSRLVENHLRR